MESAPVTRHAGTDATTLRRGLPEDAGAIADLIRRENHRPADQESIAASLASVPSIVAEDGGALVAFFYGRPFAPEIVEMQNMLVADSHRGRGLGRRMVARIEDDLRAAGFRAAIGANSVLHPGTTAERCMKARAFWVRMGWHIVLSTGGSVVLVRWLGTPAHPSPEGATAAPGAAGSAERP